MTPAANPDRWWKWGAGIAMLALIGLFVTSALVAMAISVEGAASLPPTGWLWSIVRFTLVQALASTLLSVGLAIPVALALARQTRFFGRGLLIQMTAIPLSLPVLVGAFAIIGIWGRKGLVNDMLMSTGIVDQPVSIYGLGGILLAHVFFNLPLAVRLMNQALDRIPPEHFKLSASLGLNRIDQFRFVEWPPLARILPGLAALIFMLCATSFTLVLVLGGGPQATTLEVAIYQALRLDYDPGRAVILSALQIALSLLAWSAFSLLSRPDDPGQPSRGIVRRFDAQSMGIRLVDGLVLALFALFLASPLAEITLAGLRSDLIGLAGSPQVRSALVLSLALSFASGILTVLVAALMAEARFSLGPDGGVTGKLLVGAPALTLLIPVLTLSTGWFIILNSAGLIGMMRAPMIVTINMLMALPFAMRVLEPAMSSHHARHDRLAASLGVVGVHRLRLVDLPVLARPLLAAFSFAMALSLGDLGVVAMFGSDDFITLPALLHAKLGSYRSQDADGLAFLLGLLALLLAFPAARLEANRTAIP